MTGAAFPARWRLADLSPLDETRTSTLWRANSPEYGAVVVKSLKPRGRDEIIGVSYLLWRAGDGAVRLHDVDGHHILMEFLPGKSLGDVVRAGNDDEATVALADLAGRLWRHGQGATPDLPPLADHLAALFHTDPDTVPVTARAGFVFGRELAARLLGTTTDVRPLHGDLHHDNVLRGPHGWAAIDPRGAAGDPYFELANAFRNPVGVPGLVADPMRAHAMADTFARRLGLDPGRLLDWGIALCAISMIWNAGEADSIAEDAEIQQTLIDARG